MSFDPRDLEWQRRYEERDTPWDKGCAAPALVAYLKQNRLSGRVLVPGCGRGHEVRALLEFTDCTVVGLDLSTAAVQEAQIATEEWLKDGRHDAAPRGSRFNYRAGDFFDLPEAMDGTFDWIIEHTCFCAIRPEDRPRYVQSAVKCLRPGGQLFGIFYIDPEREVGPPFGASREEISQLFQDQFTIRAEWIPAEVFPGREDRELVRLLAKV